MNDCYDEFPVSWFKNAKISTPKNVQLNYFKVQASLPLSHWREKGWIYNDDPRGGFQWYCRYFMGRRILDEDTGKADDARKLNIPLLTPKQVKDKYFN